MSDALRVRDDQTVGGRVHHLVAGRRPDGERGIGLPELRALARAEIEHEQLAVLGIGSVRSIGSDRDPRRHTGRWKLAEMLRGSVAGLSVDSIRRRPEQFVLRPSDEGRCRRWSDGLCLTRSKCQHFDPVIADVGEAVAGRRDR